MQKEVSIESLEKAAREQVFRARKALEEGRAEYSLSILGELLKHFPACSELRRMRWQAACKLKPVRKGLMSSLGSAGRGLKVGMMKGALEKKPEGVLLQCDAMLAEDPRDVSTLKLIVSAAQKLDLPGSELFAREALLELEEASEDYRLALGQCYLEQGMADKAILQAEWILQRDSGNGPARELVKNASVAASLKSGSWESNSGAGA